LLQSSTKRNKSVEIKQKKKKKGVEIEEKRRRYKNIESKVLAYDKKMSKGIEI
jgi:hypothetical protein